MGPKGCGELDTCCTLSLRWDISEKLGLPTWNLPTTGTRQLQVLLVGKWQRPKEPECPEGAPLFLG